MCLFLERRRKVEELVLRHLACVRTAVALFAEGSRACIANRDWIEGADFASRTRRAEGRADDIRREVLKTLVRGALLPPSRRQILEVVERVDSLANASEAALAYLIEQRVEVEDDVRRLVLEVLEATEDILNEVESAIRALFSARPGETLALVDRIEKAEGDVDRLERQLIRHVFRSDLDLTCKLQILGYVDRLVEISDRAEDLSDRIAVIVAERAF